MGIFGNKGKNVSRTNDVLPGYMTGEPSPTVGVDLTKAAQVSLTKFSNLDGEWALYKGSDVSFSMDRYIEDGSLDYLTEAISTVSYENKWDSDNKIPAFPYGRDVAKVPYIIELGRHEGVGKKIVRHADSHRVSRGGTFFVPPVKAIFEHYRSSEDWGQRPAIAFVQTDGLNGDMDELANALTAYSHYPIHWVFVYFGNVDTTGRGMDSAANLRKLDDGQIMPSRKVDNVSVFIAGPEPKKVTPTELVDGLLVGPNQWVVDAKRAAVL